MLIRSVMQRIVSNQIAPRGILICQEPTMIIALEIGSILLPGSCSFLNASTIHIALLRTGEESPADGRPQLLEVLVFLLVVEQWTSSTASARTSKVHGSLPTTCTLRRWRKHLTKSFVTPCGGSFRRTELGSLLAILTGHLVSVQGEYEPDPYCWH